MLMGIYLQGFAAKQVVLRAKIYHVVGIGIRVHKGNRSKIKGCEIVKCRTGIEVLSGDPFICFNTIKQSQESGVVTIAKNGLRCDGLFRFNKVFQNKDNGVLCAGENNHSRFEKNFEISSNRLAGVKAIEGASIVLKHNSIFGNFNQGILLTETASAYIEQNDIFKNFKANIAFGGDGSSDTVILRNRIHESRAEGIFIIEGGFSWIHANEIYGNNDGIVMFDSSPLLLANDVCENSRTGVVAGGCSFPRIERNLIAHNITAGLFFRDEALTKCFNNKVSQLISSTHNVPNF
jgi:nitrous oxidase accessory protein NosD